MGCFSLQAGPTMLSGRTLRSDFVYSLGPRLLASLSTLPCHAAEQRDLRLRFVMRHAATRILGGVFGRNGNVPSDQVVGLLSSRIEEQIG
jgi:hypothetical protein